METPITHITKVEIEKLWGLDDWNLTWELNPDVNILAGDNGSGKSTVLRLIFLILTKELTSNIKPNVIQKTTIGKIKFSDKRVNTLLFLDDFANNLPDKDFQKYLIERIGERQLTSGIAFEYGQNIIYIEGIDASNVVYNVSTFDQNLKPLEAVQKLAGTQVKTELDYQIHQLQDKYKDYQIRIGKRAIKALQRGSNDINEINSKLNLFWDIVDELFGNTEKRIEREKESLQFSFRQDKVLTPYDLSAGEKQMLVILLTALVQDNQPAIMIMDEPEVSLHTDWQKDLIDNIRKLNENVQLIIATHSPAMIMKGWASPKYVFQIEDLKPKPQHEPIGASQQ